MGEEPSSAEPTPPYAGPVPPTAPDAPPYVQPPYVQPPYAVPHPALAPPPPPATGSGGALVGIALGLVLVVGTVLVAGVTYLRSSSESGKDLVTVMESPVDEAQGDGARDDHAEVPPMLLKRGDCVVDSGFGSIRDDNEPLVVRKVTVVPCTQEHEVEAFRVGRLQSEDYPGDRIVRLRVDNLCQRAFEPYVGVSLRRSELVLWYYYPTRPVWHFDKGFVCLIGEEDLSNRESLAGAAR